LNNNRTANGVGEPGRAELPPSTVPMRLIGADGYAFAVVCFFG
jgi:hypothetical protein